MKNKKKAVKKNFNGSQVPEEYKKVFSKIDPDQIHQSFCNLLDDGNEDSEILLSVGFKVKDAKGIDFSAFADTIAEELGVEADQLLPLATFTGDPGAQWLFVCKDFEKNGACPVYYFSDGASQKISRSIASWLKSLERDQEAEQPAQKKLKGKNLGPSKLLRPEIKKVDSPQKLDSKATYFIWGSKSGIDWLEVGYGKRALKAKTGKWSDSQREKIMTSLAAGEPVQKQWGEAIATMERGTSKWLDCFYLCTATTYLPVISPEMKEIIESFNPKHVEFLPLRYRISAKKEGDFFVVNPLLNIDCLDKEKSGLPDNPQMGQSPEAPNFYKPKPIIDAKKLSDELIFRPLYMPTVIFFHRSIVQKLVEARLSGLLFATSDEYPACVWGGNGQVVFG